MATIAERLLGIASESIQQNAPDIAGGMTKGIELAQQAEQINMQRQKLEQDKQTLQMTRIDKFVGAIQNAYKFKDPRDRKAYTTTFLPKYRDQLGLTEVFPDETLQFGLGSDENYGRTATVVNMVANRQLSHEDAIAIFNDPQRFAEITPTPPEFIKEAPNLAKAVEFARAQKDKFINSKMQADAALGKQVQGQEASGEVELRKRANEDFNEYQKLGRAGIQANLKFLKDAVAAMKSGEIKTGGLKAYVPTDTGKKIFGSDLVAVGNKVKKAIQASLKATLGSQFTKEEGERVENRTFDGQLNTQYNIEAIQAEIDKIENAHKTQTQLFSTYVPAYNQYYKAKSFADLSPEAQQIAIQRAMQKWQVDEATAKMRLDRGER